MSVTYNGKTTKFDSRNYKNVDGSIVIQDYELREKAGLDGFALKEPSVFNSAVRTTDGKTTGREIGGTLGKISYDNTCKYSNAKISIENPNAKAQVNICKEEVSLYIGATLYSVSGNGSINVGDIFSINSNASLNLGAKYGVEINSDIIKVDAGIVSLGLGIGEVK